nr:GDSL esterase/lipase At1g71691-like [Ipomoea batatas]
MLALVFTSAITETVPVLAQAPTPGFGGGDSNSTVVPAMFIFGDSLIDNGNNNNLFSFAKANYPPYGIDFNNNPTGRFSNGYTIVDSIASAMGYMAAFVYAMVNCLLDRPTGNQMRYESIMPQPAAGFLVVLAKHFLSLNVFNFSERIPFNQRYNFEQNQRINCQETLSCRCGGTGFIKEHFFVGMGSNDYLNNYFMPGYPTSFISMIPDQFAALLQSNNTPGNSL